MIQAGNYKETVKQMKTSRRYIKIPNRTDELKMMEACYESQEMES